MKRVFCLKLHQISRGSTRGSSRFRDIVFLVSPKASRGSSAVPRGSSYKNIGFVMTPMASVSWFRLRLSAVLPWARTVPSLKHRACDDSIISVSWFRFRLTYMEHTRTTIGMIVAANPQLMRAQQGAVKTRANSMQAKTKVIIVPCWSIGQQWTLKNFIFWFTGFLLLL